MTPQSISSQNAKTPIPDTPPEKGSAQDARDLRRALGMFATGVTVVTTVDDNGQSYGLTANSFTSVSLQPPLVLWCQSVNAPSHGAFSAAQRFAINILAEEQVEVSRRFARGGTDKFSNLAVRTGVGGVPLVQGCAAYLECNKVAAHPGGDHTIFVGHVDRFECGSSRPLVFSRGKYHSAHPHEAEVDGQALQPESRAQLRAVAMATTALAELGQSMTEPVALAASVWGSFGPTVVRWEAPRRPFATRLRTGSVSPLLTSATGLAYAAFSQAPEMPAMLAAELAQQARDEAVVHTPESLASLLEEIRLLGLARVLGTSRFRDMYGCAVNAVCAPIFDASGDMVAALTAIADASQLKVDADAPVPAALRAAASGISRRLQLP